MTKQIYSIRDAKAEIFTQPFFKLTHGEAERDFTTLARDPQSNVGKYPEDYDLYYMGTYDDVSGHIKSLDTPQHVAKAINVVSKPLS